MPYCFCCRSDEVIRHPFAWQVLVLSTEAVPFSTTTATADAHCARLGAPRTRRCSDTCRRAKTSGVTSSTSTGHRHDLGHCQGSTRRHPRPRRRTRHRSTAAVADAAAETPSRAQAQAARTAASTTARTRALSPARRRAARRRPLRGRGEAAQSRARGPGARATGLDSPRNKQKRGGGGEGRRCGDEARRGRRGERASRSGRGEGVRWSKVHHIFLYFLCARYSSRFL